jgi:hypothetical protein
MTDSETLETVPLAFKNSPFLFPDPSRAGDTEPEKHFPDPANATDQPT